MNYKNRISVIVETNPDNIGEGAEFFDWDLYIEEIKKILNQYRDYMWVITEVDVALNSISVGLEHDDEELRMQIMDAIEKIDITDEKFYKKKMSKKARELLQKLQDE